jgi:hypothetical protein
MYAGDFPPDAWCDYCEDEIRFHWDEYVTVDEDGWLVCDLEEEWRVNRGGAALEKRATMQHLAGAHSGGAASCLAQSHELRHVQLTRFGPALG